MKNILTRAIAFAVSGAMALAGLSACASKTVQNPMAPRQFVFPYGTYQHSVEVTLLTLPKSPPLASQNQPDSEKIPKQFQFRGVVKISESKIKIVALSPMNTTLFRITEDRKTLKIQTEVYVEALKKVEKQMTEYYAVIRLLLTTPVNAGTNSEWHAKNLASGLPETLQIETPAGPTQVLFQDYDEQKIPNLISAENPKFKLRIKVTGYEI